TWGTVTAMAQAGIRYFSVAPNYLDRIGDILVQWENKPFWWIGPDGQSKVLVWIPFTGYAMSHRYRVMSPQLVEEFSAALEKRDYPYDIAYVRWAGHGDNAVPDPVICDFVRDWNAAHAWPRFVISSTSEAFRAFEKRYGEKLPQVRGDWTPYWEDGAASSAAETAMNRASSERLAQAETLWAMLDPKRYPAKRFEEAWNNVLLYSEHTWGAYCSVSQPANPFTADQWTIKQSYATVANLQSRQLLSDASVARDPVATPVARHSVAGNNKSDESRHGVAGYVDIFNTTSWPRSELVLIPHEISEGRNFVTDDQDQPVPAQRLITRELAVFVRNLQPFSGRRYTLTKDAPSGFGVPASAGNRPATQPTAPAKAGTPNADATAGPSPLPSPHRMGRGNTAAAERSLNSSNHGRRENRSLSPRQWGEGRGEGPQRINQDSLGKLTASGAVIENDKLRLRLDEKTGGIVELRAAGIEANLADTASGHALNDYLYLIGDDLAALQ
ncbi:MAG: hypothetical protein FJ388_22100, partial [Verrucomicrobia bacterium]|nr:hypothetical protein [Verrucomicrobiota bacterium]